MFLSESGTLTLGNYKVELTKYLTSNGRIFNGSLFESDFIPEFHDVDWESISSHDYYEIVALRGGRIIVHELVDLFLSRLSLSQLKYLEIEQDSESSIDRIMTLNGLLTYINHYCIHSTDLLTLILNNPNLKKLEIKTAPVKLQDIPSYIELLRYLYASEIVFQISFWTHNLGDLILPFPPSLVLYDNSRWIIMFTRT